MWDGYITKVLGCYLVVVLPGVLDVMPAGCGQLDLDSFGV